MFLDNILKRLKGKYQFRGIAHKFPSAPDEQIAHWPRIPKTAMLFWEVSPLLADSFDLYWGTNHFVPLVLSKPSVVTVHDLLVLNNLDREPRRWLLAMHLRGSLRRVDKIVTDSSTTADELVRVFPGIGRKVEVIRLGFDTFSENGSPPGCEFAFARSPYVVMLGAHRPRKNLPLALASVQRANEAGLNVRLCVTGNIHPIFNGLIRECDGAVDLPGIIPKEQAIGLLRGAVALLFPSIYEGFGLPILEAMAACCPVLALDTPINREIGGEAVWLLPPHVNRWANAIREVTANRALREELIGKGTENTTRFSWEATAAAYGDVFAEICQ